ncbi:hypothetical protein A8G00_23775 [Sphingobium sp. SA916]|nr:hypothetical protein A8G00_23775 [Sphingobium sp. SA916]
MSWMSTLIRRDHGEEGSTRQIADPYVDEPALRSFATDLFAEEFRSSADPTRKIKGQRFARL